MQRYSQNAYMLPDQNGAYVLAIEAEDLQRRLNEALEAIKFAHDVLEASKPYWDAMCSSIGRNANNGALHLCRVCLDENKTEVKPEPTWQLAEAEEIISIPADAKFRDLELDSNGIEVSSKTAIEQ